MIKYQLITLLWWSLQTLLQRYITVKLAAKASHLRQVLPLYRLYRYLLLPRLPH